MRHGNQWLVNLNSKYADLDIKIVEYCPDDPDYWKYVPQSGSNFDCGGKNYR